MLPLILIGLGSVTAFAGAVGRRLPTTASASRSSPAGDRISSPDTTRAVSYARTARFIPLVDHYRGEAPRWLMLGHIAFETDGNPDSSTDNIQCGDHPCEEHGLMQLMPAQSAKLGLDHQRMFEPEYSIAAGGRMYQGYAQMLKKYPIASADDFWRLAYFTFAIGGAAKTLLDLYPKGRGPITWDGFSTFASTAGCAKINRCTSVKKWLGATRAVYAFGKTIDARAMRIS